MKNFNDFISEKALNIVETNNTLIQKKVFWKNQKPYKSYIEDGYFIIKNNELLISAKGAKLVNNILENKNDISEGVQLKLF